MKLSHELVLGRENKTCPPRPVRFVIADNGCWEVVSHKKHCRGYPAIYYKKRQVQLSRVAWELHNGEVPNDLCILHKCDNRKCINPRHLFLGTKGDNARDMKEKGRSLYGERHNKAQLTEMQVVDIVRRLGSETRTELAVEYGVKRNVINKIAAGTTWKHVPRAQGV